MKFSFLVLLALVPVFIHAQDGAVTFANSDGTPIRHSTGETNINARVALYGSTATGLTSDASLTQQGAVVDTFAPGLFIGGTRYIGNPGDTVTLQVRAWTGSSSTWEEAVAVSLINPDVLISVYRPLWEQAVGGGLLPFTPITGAGRFQGMTLGPIPEPSTYALVLLGGVTLGFSLWRKR